MEWCLRYLRGFSAVPKFVATQGFCSNLKNANFTKIVVVSEIEFSTESNPKRNDGHSECILAHFHISYLGRFHNMGPEYLVKYIQHGKFLYYLGT